MRSFFLLSTLFLLASCASTNRTNAPKPPEQYLNNEEQPLLSNLTIPVNISIDDLVNSLNSRITGTLYEDNSFYDNGEDGLMFRATKSQPITLYLSGQTIKYRVPLKLWVRKSLLFGSAEAEGELALNFKTTFGINPDWSLQTSTDIEYHEWLAKPVIKTGLGDLNVESLANMALNNSKKTLTTTIDRTVSQQLSLKPYVQEAWNALQEPTLLSEEYKMWIKTTPMKIGLTPITSDWNAIRTKIWVECLNDVSVGEKPAFRANSQLPNLQYVGEDTPDMFQIRVATDVPFPEAERLAKNMMVGQVIESGKKKVAIEDIQIWGNNDKIVVNSKLSGSFNGNIYFIGKPVYNAEKNQIEVADLDFHVDTRNMLHKSASWLFQGPIKRYMSRAMTFPMADNINEMRASIQETLNYYEVQPGVVLTGIIENLQVEDTHLTPGSIRVNIFAQGSLKVDVKGL